MIATKKQKQTELPNMPEIDEMYAQGQKILSIRKELSDTKDELLSESQKLIALMREKRKYYIKVDGVKISVKDVEAKEVLAFSEG